VAKGQLRMKVIGPPGTGKTTTLLDLIEEEVEGGLTPEVFGLVTFTKNAAEEAKARIGAKFGFKADDIPHVRTIHSACYRLLGLKREQVVDTAYLAKWGAQFGWAFGGRDAAIEDDGEGLEIGDWLLGRWDLARNRWLIGTDGNMLSDDHLRLLIGEQRPPRAFTGEPLLELQEFIVAYEGMKARGGMVDYCDMLLEVRRRRMTLPLISLFIDEGQDLSPLQWAVVDQWSAPCRRVYLAGDEDQAIYGFQGAEPGHFLHWPATKAFTLPRTWRLPRSVHALAEALITRNRQRSPKVFLPREDDGLVARATWHLDDLPLEDGSWLLLARNKQFVRALSGYLLTHGVPYLNRRGMSPLAPGPTLRAAADLWQLGHDRTITLSQLANLYEHIPSELVERDGWSGARKMGTLVVHGAKAALKRAIQEHTATTADISLRAAREHGLTDFACELVEDDPFRLLTKLKPWHQDYIARVGRRHGLPGLTETPRVTVSTIHGVKGEEADHVYIASSMSGRTADGYWADPESERRVWYVGATRAKRSLHICRLALKNEELFGEWPDPEAVNHAAD
jgi:DNA helicase II / ATP-dependent DNA helicase PcrA